MMRAIRFSLFFALLISGTAVASSAGHAPYVTPNSGNNLTTLLPRKTYVVPNAEAGEEMLESRGYGDKEPEIKMMNLMMVEGSGYEGMDMSGRGTVPAPGLAPSEAPAPSKPQIGRKARFTAQLTSKSAKVGANLLEITATDADGKVLSGLKLRVSVSMTSMDMGTEEAKVKETAPGKYRAKIVFSMAGPWAVRLQSDSNGDETFAFNVAP